MAWYSEAAAALIESLYIGDGGVHVLDVRNAGAIPNLPGDTVVELPARITRTGAEPLPTDPLSPEMLGLVEHVNACRRLASEAPLSDDDEIMFRALLANPLVPGATAAASLRDVLIEANLPTRPDSH